MNVRFAASGKKIKSDSLLKETLPGPETSMNLHHISCDKDFD